MGKRKGAKTGGSANIIKSKVTQKQVDSDSEADNSDASEEIVRFNNKKSATSDDDDNEIYNLDLDEDNDEDDVDQSDADDTESGSDDDSDDEDNDLNNLVNSLPQNLRQKVLMKNGAEDDSEVSEAESEEEQDGWGKKSMHWGADTADLEIGQSIEDADDEAQAALELHRDKVARMKDEDFVDDCLRDSDVSSNEEDDEVETMGKKASKLNSSKAVPLSKSATKKNTKLLAAAGAKLDNNDLGELHLMALGEHNAANAQIEHISRDLSKLSKSQKLELIASQSPEFAGIVAELTERITELKSTIMPVKAFLIQVAQTERVDDDIVEYLEVKQQLLLSYCVNVVFYLYMKAEGKSVRAHPVMKQLLKLRYVMEKMRGLDNKLKYQIDRLVKLADMPQSEATQAAASGLLRPNPAALLARDNGDNDDSSDESELEDSQQHTGKKDGLYKPPRMTSMPYKESESASAKRDNRLDKQRKKLQNSEMMDALRDEFGSAPETSASGGISTQAGDLKRLAEEQRERDEFEEDRFTRLTMSRKDKKSIKRRTAEASRLDNFDDIGDVDGLEEIQKLMGSRDYGAMKGGKQSDMQDDDDEAFSGRKGKSGSSALQRAVAAMSGGKHGNDSDFDDDDEDGFDSMLQAASSGSSNKRRRAPSGRMDEGDVPEDGDDDNLLEDFGQKKKAYLAKKTEHYTAEPRYGGLVEEVEEGRKRAATYEIMKNKGLTPHRKKANRNPRVKKREAFAKAVISRKGQVQDVKTGLAGSYGGESTGIKAQLSRSRKIGN